jgi:hypothetical protein
MKLLYTTSLLLCLGLHLNAHSQLRQKPLQPGEPGAPALRGGGNTPLYLETFDTGLGQWQSQTQQGVVNWKWTATGPGPTTSTYPVPPLNTTPGWAIIDDDFDGVNGQSSNASLISPVIDLSNAPTQLMLRFDQYFQEFQNDATFVGISTDGGATWNETEINIGVGRDNRPNPEAKIMNISAMVAPNPANVRIRFRYTATWDYGWQVDNIGIYELPQYDLMANYGYISHVGGGHEFGRMPPSEVGTSLIVGAEVFNAGSLGLTNVQVGVEVRDASNAVVYTANLNVGNMNSWDTLFVEETITIPAPATGLYRATFTGISAQQDDDDNLENNIALRNYEVSSTYYSLDGIGNHPAGTQALTSIGTASFTGATDELFLMNYYPVSQPLTVYGIQFDLHSSSVAGGYVFVSIMDSTDVLNDVVNQPIVESPIHDINAQDLAAGKVNVMFDNPTQLGPGAYYGAVVLHSIGGTAHFRVVDDQSVGQPALTALIHITGDQTYTNGNAYAIRLILDPVVSVPQYGNLPGISIQPNPTNGIFTVNTPTTGSYGLEVFDVVGALVHTSRFTGLGTVDLGAQPTGVYLVRVQNAQGSTTMRLIKE